MIYWWLAGFGFRTHGRTLAPESGSGITFGQEVGGGCLSLCSS